MRKYIFFDLDSTLLQMDQDLFLKKYFSLIAKKGYELGYDNSFIEIFNKGAHSIIKNDGNILNEELFWNIIATKYDNIEYLKEVFKVFYDNEFKSIESIVNKNELPSKIIKHLKQLGYKLVLATNPVFPLQCTKIRMNWAGIEESDFEYISTYENSHYCKPNKNYYIEILNKLNIKEDDVVMVGNDLYDDFSDIPQNIEKILITDFLINKNNISIDIPTYTLEEFYNYILQLKNAI